MCIIYERFLPMLTSLISAFSPSKMQKSLVLLRQELEAARKEQGSLMEQLASVKRGLEATRAVNDPLMEQLASVGRELEAARAVNGPLMEQLASVGRELEAAQTANGPLMDQLASIGRELEAAQTANGPLMDQLTSIGRELEIQRRQNLTLEAMLDNDLQTDNKNLNHTSLPSVLFNALPKSASTYCFEMLRQAGGYHETNVTVSLFPHDVLAWKRYFAFSAGGKIAHHHLEATPVNLWLLRKRPVRIVLHVRDPRQALVSWHSHLVRDNIREISPLTVASPPYEWFDLPKDAQLDWLIDHHLPLFVAWIEGWLSAANNNEIDVLFTTFEEMISDPPVFFAKLSSHCGLGESTAFSLPDPRNESLFQFRAGRVDEWREVYTDAQMKSVRQAVPTHLLDRFGWQN